MPLTTPPTVAEVEQLGGLFYQLFFFPDQPTLDSFVASAIAYADAWMQGHMGGNYNLQVPSWAPVLQRRGQAMLALESIVDTLKANKAYGAHYPLFSEDTPAYENLITNDWGQKAMQALDLWVTVEQIGKGFAMPLFLLSNPIPLNSDDSNGLDPLTIQYERELAEARGLGISDVGTIRR
jgi:hypothetical protein